ncbi:MAG: ABC transporter substrate-binding protein [Eubacteriales bacterium]
MKKILSISLILVLVLSVFSGCGGGTDKSDTSPIQIGSIMPISGPVSAYGTQSRDAIVMAIDEINAAGGVLGRQLQVTVEDDQANPETTKNAFTKLVTKDGVIAIIGALTSKCSLAITSDAQARKIIMISPSSTNDTVTDAGDYIFRACYNDSFQGQVVAQFAYENLKATKAAILFDNTNDYSKGLSETFKAKFIASGGTIVAEESYATGDKDFNAQITNVKSKNPEIIFIPDYYNTVSLIAKQVRAQGITVPMLGADGWDEIVNNAGDEVVGCYYSNHYSPDANDPEVKAFVEKYTKLYNVQPNALAALAYDATYIVADAITKAGSVDPEAIKEAMMLTDKKFVTGNIKFDAKRNPIKSAVMVEIVKGATANHPTVKYAATVNPQ